MWRKSGFGAQFHNQISLTESAVYLLHTWVLKHSIFLWCLIGFPWHASHHEFCCSEPHSRQCVQRHTDEQAFMAIWVNLNFSIVKERKIPFFSVYIYGLVNAPWYTLHTYTHVLWSISCLRFCLCCDRFEKGKLSLNNWNVTMFLFYGCLRSNKDLQLWLKS